MDSQIRGVARFFISLGSPYKRGNLIEPMSASLIQPNSTAFTSNLRGMQMEYEVGGPVLNLLLLIGGKSSRMGTRKELLKFPDGRLALEHALDTLHSAVPSTSTIFISVHNETQLEGINDQLMDIITRARTAEDAQHDEHDHHQYAFPELKPIFDHEKEDIGPAAGILAAHSIQPDAKWLVLGCDYPLLPPSALQQLILEYQSPVTYFVNESGFAEPLIAIWDPAALEKLKGNVQSGKSGLNAVLKEMKGRVVKPLREQWITGTNTREEWDAAMTIVASRETL